MATLTGIRVTMADGYRLTVNGEKASDEREKAKGEWHFSATFSKGGNKFMGNTAGQSATYSMTLFNTFEGEEVSDRKEAFQAYLNEFKEFVTENPKEVVCDCISIAEITENEYVAFDVELGGEKPTRVYNRNIARWAEADKAEIVKRLAANFRMQLENGDITGVKAETETVDKD